MLMNQTTLELAQAVALGDCQLTRRCLSEGASPDTRLPPDSRPLIFAASELGHLTVVNELIRAQADLDARDERQCTALFIVSAIGHTGVARALIAAQASLDAQEEHGFTALYIAAQNNHVDIVAALLAAATDVDALEEDGGTAAHIAAQQGHAHLLCMLARAGADLNVRRGVDGRTPIHMALETQEFRALKALLSAHANPNVQDYDGCSALFLAAQNGCLELATGLVRAMADVDLPEARGTSPLFMAAQNGHFKVANLLVASQAKFNESILCPPLYIAAQNGHLEIVQLLVRAGADVDLRTSVDGASPLCVAAQKGSLEVVRTLLMAQADPDIVMSHDGTSPLNYACQHGHSEVVKELLKTQSNVDWRARTGGVTALCVAAQDGNLPLVQLLTDAVTNPDLTSDGGETALYMAAIRGYGAVADALISARADANIRQHSGSASPLFVASAVGHILVARALIHDAFADVNLPTSAAKSPLYFASQNGQAGVTDLLVRSFADVDQRQDDGSSPLYIAAHNGHADAVRCLIAAQAEINLRDFDGRTPLFTACYRSHWNVAEELLVCGADPNLTDNSGRCPARIAAERGSCGVLQLLLDCGADVTQRGIVDALCPLSAACLYGQQEAALLILRHCAAKNMGVGRALSPASASLARECIRCPLESKNTGASVVSPVHLPIVVDDATLSEELHSSLLRAGFSRSRATVQMALADALQRVIRERRDEGETFVVGSFSEGWGNSLSQLNGTTDPESDIDVTHFAASKLFHIRPNCLCKRVDPGTLVDCENGHVMFSGHTVSPSRADSGSDIRPAFDHVTAFRCCCYPDIQVFQADRRTCIPDAVQELLDRELRTSSCHLVTASPPGQEGQQLRVSTTFLERCLMRSLSTVQGQVFILLKYLIKKVICNLTTGLKAYQAKTLIFRLLDETPSDMWRPQNLLALVRKALQKLVDDLLNPREPPEVCMQHFFLPDAALYLRKGHRSKLEIARVVTKVSNDLPIFMQKFCAQLKAVSQEFHFHPLAIIPDCTPRLPLANTQAPSKFGQLFDLLSDLVRHLFYGNGSLAELVSRIDSQLPDCASTARCCLLVLAFVKHGLDSVAATILQRKLVDHPIRKGMRVPAESDDKLQTVWQQLSDTDSVWKICFWSSERPMFYYLSEFMIWTFPIETQNYADYHVINFDALFKCLCLDILGADLPQSRAWFEEVAESDAPDDQELLMALHFCREQHLLVRIMQRHRQALAAKTLVGKELKATMTAMPFLKEMSTLTTLLKVYERLIK